MRYNQVAVLAVLAAVAVTPVAALPASAADNTGTTQVTTFDPTGAVFTCPGTNYLVLGGRGAVRVPAWTKNANFGRRSGSSCTGATPTGRIC